MESFKEAFCRRFHCPPEQFERRAFRAVVYPHVRPLIFLGGMGWNCFGPDRTLITYCGILRSTRQIADEVHDYGRITENRRFSRRVLLLRASGRRLQKLAAQCLADEAVHNDDDGTSRSPFADVRPQVARGI